MTLVGFAFNLEAEEVFKFCALVFFSWLGWHRELQHPGLVFWAGDQCLGVDQ